MLFWPVYVFSSFPIQFKPRLHIAHLYLSLYWYAPAFPSISCIFSLTAEILVPNLIVSLRPPTVDKNLISESRKLLLFFGRVQGSYQQIRKGIVPSSRIWVRRFHSFFPSVRPFSYLYNGINLLFISQPQSNLNTTTERKMRCLLQTLVINCKFVLTLVEYFPQNVMISFCVNICTSYLNVFWYTHRPFFIV